MLLHFAKGCPTEWTQWGNTCKEQQNPRHQADAELDERLVGKELHTVQSQDQEEKSQS